MMLLAVKHLKVVQQDVTTVHLLGTDYILKCPLLQNSSLWDSSEGKRCK